MFSARLEKLQIREKKYITDPLNYYSLGAGLLINIIHWLYLYFKFGHTSGTVILHYNLISGPDLVDKARYAFVIPVTASVLFLMNAAIASFYFRKEKLASYFLNFAGIAIQLIFLAATLTVIFING